MQYVPSNGYEELIGYSEEDVVDVCDSDGVDESHASEESCFN